MNVAIVGSRSFRDEAMVERVVRRLIERDPDVVVVSGGAPGADTLAKRVAKRLCRRRPRTIIADWEGPHRRGAGLMRNTLIVQESDEVVAFWDGKSRGTMDTVRKAVLARKPTYVYLASHRRWLTTLEVEAAVASKH